jgi:glutaredoxin
MWLIIDHVLTGCILLMVIIRWILGSIILFFDWVFTPKGIKRNAELQAKIDEQTSKLSLYQFAACPFCVKVRRAMKRQSLNISIHDAKRSDVSRAELLEGGGKIKVPCLKIEDELGNVQWMYESSQIIQYLETKFSSKAV